LLAGPLYSEQGAADDEHVMEMEDMLDDFNADPELQFLADVGQRARKTPSSRLRAALDKPLYHGHPDTLRQWLVTKLAWKHRDNITDSAFDKLLLQEADAALRSPGVPPDSINIPGSFYLVQQILGVRPLSEYEYHVCPCQRHAWPPLHPSKWRLPPVAGELLDNAAELSCPHCAGPTHVSACRSSS
jgi:DNA-binding transcriptional LysR family regulator